MVDAIDIPEIKRYKFNMLKCFKLLFTGRIKIEEKTKK